MSCVREEQLADSVMGTILRGKEAGLKPKIDGKCMSRATRRLLQIWGLFTVCEGVLCRRLEVTDGGSYAIQLLVPQSLQEEVLTDLH